NRPVHDEGKIEILDGTAELPSPRYLHNVERLVNHRVTERVRRGNRLHVLIIDDRHIYPGQLHTIPGFRQHLIGQQGPGRRWICGVGQCGGRITCGKGLQVRRDCVRRSRRVLRCAALLASGVLATLRIRAGLVSGCHDDGDRHQNYRQRRRPDDDQDLGSVLRLLRRLPRWSWAVRAGRTPVLARLSTTTTPSGLLLLWSERSERVPRRARRAASRRLLRIPGGRLLRVSGRRWLRVSVRRRLLPRAGTDIGPLAWHRWLRPPFIPLSPLIPSRTVRVVRAHG